MCWSYEWVKDEFEKILLFCGLLLSCRSIWLKRFLIKQSLFLRPNHAECNNYGDSSHQRDFILTRALNIGRWKIFMYNKNYILLAWRDRSWEVHITGTFSTLSQLTMIVIIVEIWVQSDRLTSTISSHELLLTQLWAFWVIPQRFSPVYGLANAFMSSMFCWVTGPPQ